MKYKKLLLEYLQKELSSVDVDKLFDEVLTTDMINNNELFVYVECSYYLQVILGNSEKDLMSSFYGLVSSTEHQLTKTNLLYIIFKTHEINTKSNSSLYI